MGLWRKSCTCFLCAPGGQASVWHLFPCGFLRRQVWWPGRGGVCLQGADDHQAAGNLTQTGGTGTSSMLAFITPFAVFYVDTPLLRSACRSLLEFLRQSDTTSEPSGRSLPPSRMSCPQSVKEKDSIQFFRASLKTHLFTGRIVDVIVYDVRSHWCVCVERSTLP